MRRSHQHTVMRPRSLADSTVGNLEAQEQPRSLAHFAEVL